MGFYKDINIEAQEENVNPPVRQWVNSRLRVNIKGEHRYVNIRYELLDNSILQFEYGPADISGMENVLAESSISSRFLQGSFLNSRLNVKDIAEPVPSLNGYVPRGRELPVDIWIDTVLENFPLFYPREDRESLRQAGKTISFSFSSVLCGDILSLEQIIEFLNNPPRSV